MTSRGMRMNQVKWLEVLAWLLGGTILGATMGAIVISISHLIVSSSLSVLNGSSIGAFLGTSGAVVVLCTKASFPVPSQQSIEGVVFPANGTEDAWYYQDRGRGTHGPFNRSMTWILVNAGARVIPNPYKHIANVAPAQLKTRITRPNVLNMNTVPFANKTQLLAKVS